MCSMANYRKTKILKRGLAELDQKEKDYMENLANSLLKVQNAPLPSEKGKKKSEKRGTNHENK